MSGTPSTVTLKIAGQPITELSRIEVGRDMQNIAGAFNVALVDEARLRNALIAAIGQPPQHQPIKQGDSISFAIDNEPVLIGWIDKVSFRWSGTAIECHIDGRDKTGDLVECAALPTGPSEFHGVDLLHVATQVCAPFGIKVRAEVDIGAPFDRLSLHPHQTALTFLESASRQRSVLLVSDGVGGLLLTRGGSTRAPAPLRIGELVQEIEAEFDWTHRFSDYFVKQDSAHRRTTAAALDHSVAPLSGGSPPASTPSTASAAEALYVGTTGHATDPAVTRWRPTVRLTRSQSGMSTVQEQAEWACRVARGQSDRIHVTALGFRAGPSNALWRPNQLTALWDPYSGIDRDVLIAGVQQMFDDQGQRTRLRIVGPEAYDRINESDRRKSKRGPAAKRNLDSTVTPLSAP